MLIARLSLGEAISSCLVTIARTVSSTVSPARIFDSPSRRVILLNRSRSPARGLNSGSSASLSLFATLSSRSVLSRARTWVLIASLSILGVTLSAPPIFSRPSGNGFVLLATIASWASEV